MGQICVIHSIFIGQPRAITDERGTWTSSIYRDRVDGPVPLLKGGFVGDRVTQPYHGGPDADVCIHLMDHYRFWNEHFSMALEPGRVGENLTLDGITEDQICAGDIVRVGNALAQVTGPRVPCANLARSIGRSDWVRLTVSENRTGFYASVLEPGTVQPGDVWDLQERPNPDGSIPALNRCMYLQFDPALARAIPHMQGLSEWWKEQTVEKQSLAGAHWSGDITA